MSSVVSEWVEKKLLIIVKAYPEISKSSGEIACTAGIDEFGNWFRVFPIPFRELPRKQQFRKWQWIAVSLAKHSDPRPESYKILPSSIKLGEFIDPAKKINLRKKYILPGIVQSIHQLEKKGMTLGAFLPKQVLDLKISVSDKEWSAKQKSALSQQKLFTKNQSVLKQKPLKFQYIFTCNDKKCSKTHKIEMIDWEIHQTYFNFLEIYGSELQAKAKLKEKWLELHHRKKKTYFIAGTHRRFKTWMLIGYFSLGFYDKIETYQESLL